MPLFFSIAVFALTALRSFVDTDYQSYVQLYDYFNYAEMDEVSKLAHKKGFVVPLKIITLFFGDGAFIVTPQLHI